MLGKRNLSATGANAIVNQSSGRNAKPCLSPYRYMGGLAEGVWPRRAFGRSSLAEFRASSSLIARRPRDSRMTVLHIQSFTCCPMAASHVSIGLHAYLNVVAQGGNMTRRRSNFGTDHLSDMRTFLGCGCSWGSKCVDLESRRAVLPWEPPCLLSCQIVLIRLQSLPTC